jgi:hypothetical protein
MTSRPTITGFIIVVLASLSLLISCSNSGSDYVIAEHLYAELRSTPSNDWHVETDPLGDFFESYIEAPNIHDILLVATTQDTDLNFLIVAMEFNEEVIPATWSGLPEQLFGYVEIDCDQNQATGSVSSIDNIITSDALPTPLTNMGVDYIISLHEYDALFQSAVVYLVDSFMMWEPAGYAHVLFHENTCLLEIPLVVLGDDEGNIDFGLYIGTEPGPTDITHKISYAIE